MSELAALCDLMQRQRKILEEIRDGVFTLVDAVTSQDGNSVIIEIKEVVEGLMKGINTGLSLYVDSQKETAIEVDEDGACRCGSITVIADGDMRKCRQCDRTWKVVVQEKEILKEE